MSENNITDGSQQMIKEDISQESAQSETQSQSDDSPAIVELNANFSSFVSLRGAIDKYQRENHVQLIVKDSKLLSSESTRKVIPKVYHLVNQKLMYHSITYCCKCHGELKQKPGSRIKNIGAKRLSCPMYMRFKLSSDLQSLVLFDIMDTHNHSTDPNTFQLSPRQQVYRLSAINKGKPDPGDFRQVTTKTKKVGHGDVQALIATAIKDVNAISSLGDTDYEPPAKALRIPEHSENSEPPDASETKQNFKVTEGSSDSDVGDDGEDGDDDEDIIYKDNPNTPLDLDSSSCSDSDDEIFREEINGLPLPIRLLGSAVRSHPELIASSKELIESQKNALIEQRKFYILKNKLLEMKTAKLAMELKSLERSQASTASDQSTTVYLQS